MIMKESLLYILSALSLASILFSCEITGDNTTISSPPPYRIITSIDIVYDGINNLTYKYSYDNHWQLKSVNSRNTYTSSDNSLQELIIEDKIIYQSDKITKASEMFNVKTSDTQVLVIEHNLNNKGMAFMGKGTNKYNGRESSYVYQLMYDTSGRADRTVSSHRIPSDYGWTNNSLTKITEDINSYANEITLSYTNYKNKTNLDLNVILTNLRGMPYIPSLVRKAGKSTSPYLIDKYICRSIYGKNWDEDEYRFKYNLDNDNYPTKVEVFRIKRNQSSSDEEILDSVYVIEYDKAM